jgi:hypothetical protein
MGGGKIYFQEILFCTKNITHFMGLVSCIWKENIGLNEFTKSMYFEQNIPYTPNYASYHTQNIRNITIFFIKQKHWVEWIHIYLVTKKYKYIFFGNGHFKIFLVHYVFQTRLFRNKNFHFLFFVMDTLNF